MKSNNKQLSKEYFFPIFCIFVGIVFFLSDTLGILNFVRSGISFVMQPVAYEGNRIGGEGKEYLETFVRLNEFRKEYNELSIDIYQKEVENSFFILLKEENESLKRQISLGGSNSAYVMAKVLSGGDYEIIRINKGESSGIAVGDVVVWGNMFVGIVTRVDREGSLVRLPSSNSSNLEVVIVRGGIEEARVLDNFNALSKGVVKGSLDGIRIENMSMEADLKNGDVVIVNDTKVGEYLVLGYLVGLSENPAATSRSGYVSTIVDYDKLITVFVRTDH
jgi:cell shape-determining protein MreC